MPSTNDLPIHPSDFGPTPAASSSAPVLGVGQGIQRASVSHNLIYPIRCPTNGVHLKSLFDLPLILDRLKIDCTIEHVAELGCGYGTFTLPVARRIRGTAFTFDIDRAMIARTIARAADAGVSNINAAQRDVLAAGFGLEPESCDAVLLFNILHFPQPEDLVRQAATLLRPGGRVLAIHWRADPATPRGPPLHLRPTPADAEIWAKAAGLTAAATVDLPPWHFGVALSK